MVKITTKELLNNFIISENNQCVYKSNIPCIIDFYATWCKPCDKIKQDLIELEKINKDIIFYMVDIEEEYELAELFSIKNLPTLILCSNNQDTIRMNGTIGKQFIQQKINYINQLELV